jgi:glycosyltransferase involved in cell wall biosynthesis
VTLMIFCPRASIGLVGFCNALSRGATERAEKCVLVHGEPEMELLWTCGPAVQLEFGQSFASQAKYSMCASVYRDIGRVITEFSVDRIYILSSHPIAIPAALWWLSIGKRVAFHMHDPIPHSSQRGARLVACFNRLIGWIPKLRLVVSSNTAAALAIQLNLRARADQVHVVPIPTSVTRRVNVLPRAERNLVLMIGRIEGYKGPERFIEIARRIAGLLPACRFVLAGSDDQKLIPPLRTIAAQAGVALQLGRLSDEEFSTLISSAVVVCMPYRDSTDSGVAPVCFEHGTPLVAFAVGGLARAVENGRNGLLCEPGDIDAFGSAILSICTNQPLFDSLSLGAVVAASRHQPAAVLANIEQVLA